MNKPALPVITIAARLAGADPATLNGPVQFQAANPLEFFHRLRAASPEPCATYEDFLLSVARLATNLNGAPHDGADPEALARDLQMSGLISADNPTAFQS